MKENIDIYLLNQSKIEKFIEDSLEKQGELCASKSDKFKKMFKIFPSLELAYIVEHTTKVQTSGNFYKHKYDENEKGKSRDSLIDKLSIKENGFAFTQPYQNSATKNICITVSKKEGDKIIFMDLIVEVLLERLGFIEKHKIFSEITKSFYLLTGYFMMLLSLVTILYAAADFLSNLFHSKLSIDTIFKPIIATTLGLAIFDLAKTILEQEVYFKSYVKDSKIEIKVLTKFLVTILIALSIETLMVVFKIAIENPDNMINALYLMIGTSIFMFALSLMIYITKRKR
ncbi:MAG: hypothetical protein Q9M43_05025 [Sulfurimonas sp.]|nr:hypothetical protein [Sulfurimonas sp.]